MSLLARCCCGAVGLAARLPVPERLDGLAARAAIGAIKLYQRWLSPRTGVTCLFSPTCSHRALAWLSVEGFSGGMRQADAQLRRCGGAYSLTTTVSGETWLVTADSRRFGPEELSPHIYNGSRAGML